MKVGLLGYGTVGKGVYQLLLNHPLFSVKWVHTRTTHHDELPGIYTDSFLDIVNDQEVSVIIEVIGGIDDAYHYIKQALKARKHVITANKDIVALYLDELSRLANENGVTFCFEAAVGGGIPIIRNIVKEANIKKIQAILNGTTNYILTQVFDNDLSLAEATAKAQALGFAEADLTADMGGLDSVRKIAILSTLAFKTPIDIKAIKYYGLLGLDEVIIQAIKERNLKLKFVASSKMTNAGISICVEPVLIDKSHFLNHISDEYNMIQIDSPNPLLFIGKGAGSLPTASAIISDLKLINEKAKFSVKLTNKYHLNYQMTEEYFIYDEDVKILQITNQCDLPESKFKARIIKGENL